MTDVSTNASDTKSTYFMLSDHSYQILKKLVQVVLPALSALYFGLAQIWGLPAAEQVVGTIALITTFLGVALGISTNQYNNSDAPYDGKMVVIEPSTPDGVKTLSLELDGDPEEIIANKDSITFKITDAVAVSEDDI